MNYEDLDKDTKKIIDGMCHNCELTKAQAILTLVEFGMLSMKAAVSCNHPFNNIQKKVMKVVFNSVNKNPQLKRTAEAYDSYWELPE